MKIVIRAGGLGTRLWPVSRTKSPKQFHALMSENTLLEDAIHRVRPIAAVEDIYISTNADSEDIIRQQHYIPDKNIIIEPERKDTAAAIGLESVIIQKRDPEAIVASLGSDHSVRRVPEFQRMLQIVEEMVRRHPDYIIPIGIRATRADTGYGYIECGEVLDMLEGRNLWKVNRFTEKPDREEAKKFVQEANYLWNANMFVWKVSTILELYKKHLPEMYMQLMVIQKAVDTEKQESTINEIYPKLKKIAVDYAIIEKAKKIAAVAADIGWSDIGDWARLKNELTESEHENATIGAQYLGVKTENTLVYSSDKEKMIVTLGVENLIIVDTGDALLVCDKYRSEEVRDIVRMLKERKKDNLV